MRGSVHSSSAGAVLDHPFPYQNPPSSASTLTVIPVSASSVVAGARNHLQASRMLGFCLRIPI
jgi:hypothetical protein